MGKGKYEASSRLPWKRLLSLALALLLLSSGLGETLAWLTDLSGPVVHSFTPSEIRITLADTTGDYPMVPGTAIARSAAVTVSQESENCWLFVELQESANLHTYLSYQVADGWTQGDGTQIPATVWYRKIHTPEEKGIPIPILAGDQITVRETVTAEQMEAAALDPPTLTFCAYACQLLRSSTAEFTPQEAWTALPKVSA